MRPRAPVAGATALILLTALALLAFPAQAADLSLAQSTPLPGGGQSWSVPIQTLVVLTSLTFLPSVVLLMTGFTRIVIVLSLLRQALGTQASPPNPVIIGLALFLTLGVMAPTLERIYRDAYQPLSENRIGFQEAAARAEVPMQVRSLLAMRAGDVISFDLPKSVEASVDGVPIFGCRFGTMNGQYAVKVDRVLAASVMERMNGDNLVP